MPKRTRSTTEIEQRSTPRKRRSTSKDEKHNDINEDTITLTTPTANSARGKRSVTRASTGTSYDTGERQPGRNDRSARKKSAAALSSLATDADDDGDAIDSTEAALAEVILDEGDAIDSAEDDHNEADQAAAGAEDLLNGDATLPDADAPVKRGRGRPKGRRKQRTPTPPPDLPAHELYFFHNRTTASQTSTNTLPAHALLNHEDYLTQIKAYQDPHQTDIKRLKKLHFRSFEQWQFELDQGFSLCLYGFGSKRSLMLDFVDHVYHASSTKQTIVIVNGYNTSVGIKDVLNSVANVFFGEDTALPGQPAALLETIIAGLSKKATPHVLLVIHDLDSINLRKASVQPLIAKLASLSQISLLASCDSLNFPLMWDLSLLRQYNFVYHDATTFEPWTVEIDAVEEMNALLGRSSRRLAGKDGVGYVLRSLPENARSLFKILVTEQLALGDIDFSMQNGQATAQDDEDLDMLGLSDEELAATQQNTPSKRGRGRPKKTKTPVKTKSSAPVEGVEYRMLYHKAVEEFVCSSEVSFRTLLKEFHDHQMIESRKDPMGTERLIVPFRREELEAILEEL